MPTQSILDLKKVIDSKKQTSIPDQELIIYLHYALISKFGWIPLKELEEIPIPMLLNIMHIMQKEEEEKKKLEDKMKAKRR